jgi:BON domain
MTTLRTSPYPLRASSHALSARLRTTVLSLSLGVLASGLLAGCKGNPAAPPPDDAALTHAIQNKIATDGAISSEPIQASVQNSIATLNGSVSSDAARSLAANDAAQIPGIKTVVNNLTVQPPPAVAQLPAPAPPPVRPERAERHKRAMVDTQNASMQPPPPPVQSAPPPSSFAAAVPPPPPPPPPPPAFRSITLPPDTVLPVRLNQTLDSATTQTGDVFNGVIASDVIVDNMVVLPQGTPVSGRVVAVQEAAHFKGNSLLTIELTTLDHHGEHIALTTDSFSKAGSGRGKNTAEKVGGGAAVGAILGGILGGGKGAAIGAAAGGGAGAGVNAATRGQQVQIPAETLVRFHLSNSIALRVSTSGASHHDDGDLQRHYN